MKKSLLYLASIITSIAFLAGCDTKTPDADFAPVNDIETSTVAVEEIKDDNSKEEVPVTDVENTEPEVTEPEIAECELEDGVYIADFNTDSTMFHANEMCDGKGTLTVKDGQMTIHVSLPSKTILNLYSGLAEDAQKDGAVLLEPTVDLIDYNDGTTDEVNGFDILASKYVGGPAIGIDPSVTHQNHTVRVSGSNVKVVTDHDDQDLPVPGIGLEEAHHVHLVFHVEVRRRFVQYQDVRFLDQSAGDENPLHLSRTELADVTVAELLELHEFDRGIDHFDIPL